MESNDEQIRAIANSRISCLILQEKCVTSLTPLLLKQIRHAIVLHSEAVKQPDLTANEDLLKALDNAHDRVSEHWCKVHDNYMTSSSLQASISVHQRFLTHFLLDEYTSWAGLRDTKSLDVYDWACKMADLIQAHGVAGNDSKDSDGEYHRRIATPLEEMGLNRSHVEGKMRAVAAVQRGQSCNYVRHLVRQCDWQKLAEVLFNDRELANDLFEPRPVMKGAFNHSTRAVIVKKIDSTTDKYFTRLASPTDYTLSKHAIPASAKHSSSSSSYHSENLDGGGDDGRKSIYDIITNGFNSLGSSLTLRLRLHTVSSRMSRDEKAPLVGFKEK